MSRLGDRTCKRDLQAIGPARVHPVGRDTGQDHHVAQAALDWAGQDVRDSGCSGSGDVRDGIVTDHPGSSGPPDSLQSGIDDAAVWFLPSLCLAGADSFR